MKRFSYFILILILLFAIVSCSEMLNDAETDTINDTAKQLTPTGRSDYPSDQVWCEMLVYNQIQWISYYGKTVDELPEGYTAVGKIVMDDVYREPKEDFYAAHVPEGSEVYAKTVTHHSDHVENRKDEIVYALINGKYMEFQYRESVIEVIE